MPRACAENEIVDLCMNFIFVHQSERVCPLILIFFKYVRIQKSTLVSVNNRALFEKHIGAVCPLYDSTFFLLQVACAEHT